MIFFEFLPQQFLWPAQRFSLLHSNLRLIWRVKHSLAFVLLFLDGLFGLYQLLLGHFTLLLRVEDRLFLLLHLPRGFLLVSADNLLHESDLVARGLLIFWSPGLWALLDRELALDVTHADLHWGCSEAVFWRLRALFERLHAGSAVPTRELLHSRTLDGDGGEIDFGVLDFGQWDFEKRIDFVLYGGWNIGKIDLWLATKSATRIEGSNTGSRMERGRACGGETHESGGLGPAWVSWPLIWIECC